MIVSRAHFHANTHSINKAKYINEYNHDLCVSIKIAMALNIRNPKTEKLACDLAELTGETKTKAVTIALQERLDKEKQIRSTAEKFLFEELLEIAKHSGSLPVLDKRSEDEILGYDHRGVPSE